MFNKMKAEWKAKWVAALRSGKFKQGPEGVMRSQDWDGKVNGYCCLGVLQEITAPADLENVNYESFPSPACLRAAGLPKYRKFTRLGNPEPAESGIVMTLAKMNDGDIGSRRSSFDEIADFIEKNL